MIEACANHRSIFCRRRGMIQRVALQGPGQRRIQCSSDDARFNKKSIVLLPRIPMVLNSVMSWHFDRSIRSTLRPLLQGNKPDVLGKHLIFNLQECILSLQLL